VSTTIDHAHGAGIGIALIAAVLEGDRHDVATIHDLYGVSTVVAALVATDRQALHFSVPATSDVLFSLPEQHQKDNTYRSVIIRSRDRLASMAQAIRYKRQQLEHYVHTRAEPADGSQLRPAPLADDKHGLAAVCGTGYGTGMTVAHLAAGRSDPNSATKTRASNSNRLSGSVGE
jgi:hypothetical protein